MISAIGLMSGTSLDGVDAAAITTDGERVAGFGPSLTLPYPAELKDNLRDLIARAPDIAEDDPVLRRAVRQLTEIHAEAVASLGVRADLIGFHGQTIWHAPHLRRTWQIGDAALLARLTRTDVAHDFRSADVAAGGQGAPLVPLFHQALARDLPKPLAILNLGGVGNVTWLGEGGAILACDTGPGNALLDDFIRVRTGQEADWDGALALAGRIDEPLLARWLSDPYFAQPAPKSLDRQHFARVLNDLSAHNTADAAATLAAFTAQSAARTPLPAPPRQWLVTGGGRRNPALMAALAQATGAPVRPVEAVGWDGDALEAQAFAFLATRVKRGLPLSLPETTGVPKQMPGGALSLAGLC
jgi:anhydro-N-acetylmuramic acid kinase